MSSDTPDTGPPPIHPDGDGLRRLAALVAEAALAVFAFVRTLKRHR
ncbi:hypothetical protein [Rubrivirga sp. SAORIC476]|nr:hypothetical protein [Rubrivirga sp. SAORIC476]